MKKITGLLAFFVFTATCYSQTNLVNNGSFESYSNCPTAFSQVDYASGWNKSLINNPGTSHTEYVNSCNTGNWVGVPTNGWGTQAAYQGNGYVCQTMKAPALGQDYRENIYSQLTTNLIVGHVYKISYYVSLGEESQYTSDNICAKLSTTTSFPINNQAHCASGLVTSNSAWVLVSDTIIADSAYSHIGIGNFYTDANTQYTQTYSSANLAYSVYYTDDVQVVEIPGKNNIEELNQDFAISISPNPAHDNITISGFGIGTKGLLEMYSIDGKLIATWNVAVTSGNSVMVTLPSNCPKGYYLVRFVGETSSRTEKLLIE